MKYIKHFWLIFLGSVLFPGMLFGLGNKKACLEFVPSPSIEDQSIELSEVCTVDCEDPYLMEKLRAITVAEAPEPGKEKTLSKYEVLATLRREGISSSDIQFTGRAQTRFSYRSADLDPEAVVQAAKEYVLKETGFGSEDVIFEVTKKPQKLLIPEGEARFEVYPLSSRELVGNTALSVNIVVDENIIETVPVTFNVRVFQPVLVAQTTLERGDRLQASDFEVKRCEVTRCPKGIVDSFSEIQDMVPRRVIRSMEIIDIKMLEEPELVKKGDIVKVILESGALRISTKGIALTSGKRGDVIRVRNIDTKRIISAVVDKAGFARLSI